MTDSRHTSMNLTPWPNSKPIGRKIAPDCIQKAVNFLQKEQLSQKLPLERLTRADILSERLPIYILLMS